MATVRDLGMPDSDAVLAAADRLLADDECASWLRVDTEDVSSDGELAAWVERSTAYARSLPPKR